MARKILLADDSESIVEILSLYLTREGYEVISARDGTEALEKFLSLKPDLALLDIMMPGKDGLEVLQEIRRSGDTPVIMITARSEDADVIMGLDYGADDYIVKPFSPPQVMARIRSVLRRIPVSDEEKTGLVRHSGLEIDIEAYEVRINGQALALTRKETEILWLLASHPGQVFSRDHLLDRIWGYDYFGDTRAVDTHIKRLRAKLDACGRLPWEIKTVWGVGYKFEVDHAQQEPAL